jgi:hypothetical protein
VDILDDETTELAPTLLDRLRRRVAPGIGPIRGSEQTTTNRLPIGGQHEMKTADQPALLQDSLFER